MARALAHLIVSAATATAIRTEVCVDMLLRLPRLLRPLLLLAAPSNMMLDLTAVDRVAVRTASARATYATAETPSVATTTVKVPATSAIKPRCAAQEYAAAMESVDTKMAARVTSMEIAAVDLVMLVVALVR